MLIRSLMIVPVLAIGLAMPAAAQEKQTFSISKGTGDTRYTQEHMIDVGDVPGHQVRIYEITVTYKKDELAFDGVSVKEGWSRSMSDYTNEEESDFLQAITPMCLKMEIKYLPRARALRKPLTLVGQS